MADLHSEPAESLFSGTSFGIMDEKTCRIVFSCLQAFCLINENSLRERRIFAGMLDFLKPTAMMDDFVTYYRIRGNRTIIILNYKLMMTLEERILDYINNHPGGVKISEMEAPFGETRMKLGFIAKNLLEKGMIQKVDSTHYPGIYKMD